MGVGRVHHEPPDVGVEEPHERAPGPGAVVVGRVGVAGGVAGPVVLPVVGDLLAMSPVRRVGVAVGLVLAFLVVTAALALLLS